MSWNIGRIQQSRVFLSSSRSKLADIGAGLNIWSNIHWDIKHFVEEANYYVGDCNVFSHLQVYKEIDKDSYSIFVTFSFPHKKDVERSGSIF